MRRPGGPPPSARRLSMRALSFVLGLASAETAREVFAANRLATGGIGWAGVGALHLKGTIAAGGPDRSGDATST
jgi:hypothetical protein